MYMRIRTTNTKSGRLFYVIKTYYDANGKEHSLTVEKLGNEHVIQEKYNCDPDTWAKEYVKKLNEQEKQRKRKVLVPFEENKIIDKDLHSSFNGGYLFLQSIYHKLGLHKICKNIETRHNFDFNLDSILSRLIYSRIMFPASKRATFELSEKYLEQPDFEEHQIYRALSVLADESDFIQEQLYKNSLKTFGRKNKVIYYDCTNFFFEIEQPDVEGLRKYGISKEHRPNPIVQMGLFMDADGIPLAFDINPGNTNEQITMRPLEKKLLSNFGLSKFVVCTDAGLASYANRKYNTFSGRSFITTQPIKKLKNFLMEWVLDSKDWSLKGSDKTYDISNLDDKNDEDKIFYKERWINEDGLEQKLIVTYSLKYKKYQEKIRNGQIERAEKLIKSNPTKVKRKGNNDYRRFISEQKCTDDGEVAENNIFGIDMEQINYEKKFDGFYAVCTDIEDDTEGVVQINQRRWEIEECFRIMKSEFKSRPVYLQRSDRIKAHFMTCFISLILYRFLEKTIDEKYTCSTLIKTLKDMNFYQIPGEGYIPTYTRTDVTDTLHDAFGFRTDYQIMSNSQMKKIFKDTKN